MGKKNKLFKAFALGLKPEQTLTITQWAAENVRLARSSRSTYADLSLTPWLVDPLQTIIDNESTDIVISAPVGSGKTSLLEILACYIVKERPGPCLFVSQTDNDAALWMETGLLPALKGCEGINALWPTNRHAVKKEIIAFPHMPLFCAGANLSNLQSKSVDYAVADECWLFKAGMMNELKKRNHDRPFSKFVALSQPGNAIDDFTRFFNTTFKYEFQFLCPHCGERHPWRWENLKWEKVPHAELDPVYTCECGATFKDEPQTRRSLSESGAYVAIDSENPVSGRVGYTYNALAVWWVSWKALVVEWLQANEQKKKGDLEPLKQFLNKRLAKPWDEVEYFENAPIKVGGYFFADKVEYDKTLLTVDTQLDYFQYVVRTWSKSGESRLLECGKLLTFADIEAKRLEWKIETHATAIDSAYRTDEVLNACALYGWLAFNGFRSDSFTVITKQGKTIQRIYSKVNHQRTSNGKTAKKILYSSNRAKSILHNLKTGAGVKWEVPNDVSEDYLNQMNSEILRQIGDKIEWKQVKEKNHLWDCEVEQVILAIIQGCYPAI